jgi:hypothetical protein
VVTGEVVSGYWVVASRLSASGRLALLAAWQLTKALLFDSFFPTSEETVSCLLDLVLPAECRLQQQDGIPD